MNRTPSILTTIAASIFTASALAAGPLAPVNTEQRAAAALITVIENAGRAQSVVAVIAADSTPYAQQVFNSLNAAAITASALRNMPVGATRPCVNGGSFNVRMPRSLPRVLQIEWTNCQVIRWDPTTATGPGQITLFSDNFRPEQVAGIRLGESTRDLVIGIGSGDTFTVRTRNVRMTGLIPMFGPDYTVDSYTGYLYDISGFVHDVSETAHFDVFNSAENVAAMGVIANLQEGYYYDEEQRLLWGKLATTQIDPNWGTLTNRIGVENLAVHRIYDYNAWTSSFAVDGAMDVEYPKGGRAGELYGCRDGRFSARTVKPLFTPDMNAGHLQDSGEIRINGVATARYYSASTTPPHLPAPTNGMLISLAVRDVGTFNYDEGGFPSPLVVAATCP